MTIDSLPQPPSTSDPDNFDSEADALLGALPNLVTQINATTTAITASAADASISAGAASDSAVTAASRASAASVSAESASNSAGAASLSAKAASDSATAAAGSATAAATSAGNAAASSTTAQTAVNAAIAAGAAAGIPPPAGNALKVMRVNAAGTGLELADVSIPYKAYANRADLRTLTGANVIVESLGLFEFIAGSTEPDDDATCFATAAGAWLLTAADVDFESGLWAPEIAALAGKFLRASFAMALTSVVAGSSNLLSVIVPGAAPGDTVIVTPSGPFQSPNTGGDAYISAKGYVSATNTVVVTVRSTSTATQALTPGTWSVLVIKQ